MAVADHRDLAVILPLEHALVTANELRGQQIGIVRVEAKRKWGVVAVTQRAEIDDGIAFLPEQDALRRLALAWPALDERIQKDSGIDSEQDRASGGGRVFACALERHDEFHGEPPGRAVGVDVGPAHLAGTQCVQYLAVRRRRGWSQTCVGGQHDGTAAVNDVGGRKLVCVRYAFQPRQDRCAPRVGGPTGVRPGADGMGEKRIASNRLRILPVTVQPVLDLLDLEVRNRVERHLRLGLGAFPVLLDSDYATTPYGNDHQQEGEERCPDRNDCLVLGQGVGSLWLCLNVVHFRLVILGNLGPPCRRAMTGVRHLHRPLGVRAAHGASAPCSDGP